MDLVQSIELVTNEVRNANIYLLIPKGDKNSQRIFRENNEILLRRKIRNLCFRIREDRIYDTWEKERAPGVKAIMEGQWKQVGSYIMNWNNFASIWDIHPKYPLVIITQPEWYHAGGKIDKKTGLLIPTAFTAVVQSMPIPMQEQHSPETFIGG